ncbi:hypothetical protein TNCV_1436141 [Trichonephila clavipes]|nr:hypothetical protein TNCV_1436141 [Trichonephila clavipes]
MSVDRPSIWCTRYGDVVDLSHDGLLSQNTNGVVTKTEDARGNCTRKDQEIMELQRPLLDGVGVSEAAAPVS